MSLPIYTDLSGVKRVLAKLAPDPEKRKLFKASANVFQLIPRSQWKPVKRRDVFGPDYFLNQQNHGSCVGFSAAMAFMREWVLRGNAFQRFSGAYIYSWINGGRDNGAQIADALTELKEHGVCLEATVGWNTIYRNQAKVGDAEAARFKILDGLTINDGGSGGNTFDWIGSILQQGGIPQFAIEVGGNFERFTSSGIAGFSRGAGNHSVIADGLDFIDGQWVLDNPQSWGLSFGQNGRCYLTEQHVQGVVQAGGQDSFAHLIGVDDPKGDNPVVPAE